MQGRVFLPKLLTARRAQRGLSITALAAAAELAYDYVWRLEAGKHPRPSPVTLVKLASALGCTPDDLSEAKTAQEAA